MLCGVHVQVGIGPTIDSGWEQDLRPSGLTGRRWLEESAFSQDPDACPPISSWRVDEVMTATQGGGEHGSKPGVHGGFPLPRSADNGPQGLATGATGTQPAEASR